MPSENFFETIDLNQLAEAKCWQDKFRLISQWGDQLPPAPDIRSNIHRVAGCEAQAWLTHTTIDGKHFFRFDSDSRLIRGLACAVLHLTNGKSAEQIDEAVILHQLAAAGIQKHLSPSRNNGLRALIISVASLAQK